jgi:hypothetical protein
MHSYYFLYLTGQKSALFWFLRGTCDKASKLSILGGYSDVLRYIWTLSCEEWWDLHIIRFKPNETTTTDDNDFIPELLNFPFKVLPDESTYSKLYPKDRQSVAGCPIAILEKNVTFPALLNTEDPLYVNMMPIDLHDLRHSLPKHCHGYLPLIESCIKCLGGSSNSQISYLTVDERPMRPNAAQRREGLHVESPGLLPITAADTEIDILPPLHERYMHQSGSYVPGQCS